MLLAAFFLATTLYPDENVLEDSVTETTIKEVTTVEEVNAEPEIVFSHRESLITPTEEERKPITNFEPLVSPAAYQEQISKLPPLFTPPPVQLRIGEVFVYEVLRRSHVRRMMFDEYQQCTLREGNIAAYIWMSHHQPAQILQYAVIATSYGNVYVTCAINDQGEIIDPDAPLNVYYDNVALAQMVAVAAENAIQRFPTYGGFDKDHIRCIDDLNFLFGNPLVAGESYNVSFML